MSNKEIKMAICYDFDGTLSPGYMHEYGFFDMIKANSADFWKRADEMSKQQCSDSIIACMKLMLDEAKKYNLSFHRQDFQKLGANVELYPGVIEWFERITNYAKSKNIILKHYIISSGIKEIIEGTPIANKFDKIFASSFMYDGNGIADWPAVAINYTTKTQFLYRINKGTLDETDNLSINKYISEEERDVPLTNVIYIGDGETDIPCMKMIKKEGGHSIGVYPPNNPDCPNKTKQLFTEKRVNFIAPADYSADKIIDVYVKNLIDKIAADHAIAEMERKTTEIF